MTTLYKIVDNYDDADYNDFGELTYEIKPDMAKWEEFCLWKWEEVKPFFLPSNGGIFRSRSGAMQRAANINWWGGKVKVVECEPVWEELGSAVKRRQRDRINKRIKRKQAELTALYYQRDGFQEVA